MIEIKSKISHKTVETICNDEDFKIDSENIYSKDEFNQEVFWSREAYYAIHRNNLMLKKSLNINDN